MNDQLKLLYEKYWDSFITNVYKATMKEGKPICAYPFLIQATPHYLNAQKRIMFCGQETLSWGREFPHPDTTSPCDLMGLYDSFVNNNNRGEQLLKPGYNRHYKSPYWNFQWRIMQAFPEVGFVSQNLVKSGKYGSEGCNNAIYELTKQFFPVWKEELRILKPDMIIFLTGNYDWRIREVIGDFTKIPVGQNSHIDQLQFKNIDFPFAVRTNHPAYLQRHNRTEHRYFNTANELIELIKNHLLTL